jgi:hypothetical protein
MLVLFLVTRLSNAFGLRLKFILATLMFSKQFDRKKINLYSAVVSVLFETTINFCLHLLNTETGCS